MKDTYERYRQYWSMPITMRKWVIVEGWWLWRCIDQGEVPMLMAGVVSEPFTMRKWVIVDAIEVQNQKIQ